MYRTITITRHQEDKQSQATSYAMHNKTWNKRRTPQWEQQQQNRHLRTDSSLSHWRALNAFYWYQIFALDYHLHCSVLRQPSSQCFEQHYTIPKQPSSQCHEQRIMCFTQVQSSKCHKHVHYRVSRQPSSGCHKQHELSCALHSFKAINMIISELLFA